MFIFNLLLSTYLSVAHGQPRRPGWSVGRSVITEPAPLTHQRQEVAKTLRGRLSQHGDHADKPLKVIDELAKELVALAGVSRSRFTLRHQWAAQRITAQLGAYLFEYEIDVLPLDGTAAATADFLERLIHEVLATAGHSPFETLGAVRQLVLSLHRDLPGLATDGARLAQFGGSLRPAFVLAVEDQLAKRLRTRCADILVDYELNVRLKLPGTLESDDPK